MEGGYLTTLPREVVRALAGFNSNGGEFFLPRDECKVPDGLLKCAFPSINEWQPQLDDGKLRDIVGQGFLRLLTYLRVVLIQG